MYRRNYLILVLTTLLFAVGSIAVFGQNTSPVRGEVKLKKKDGTVVPVEGAVVDAYRTDIDRGKMPSAKTNKRGEFSFVGFPLGQTFTLAASAPGVGPRVEPGVKAGRENIVIMVEEGDGRTLSEAEVRQVASVATTLPAGGLSEAQRKQLEKERADVEKKNAEILEKNKKLQEGDEAARRSNTEGVAALKAKDYNTAITKFSEGVAAVPDFVGSTPVLLNGKLVALKSRGYESYKEGAGSTDPALRKAKYEAANKDYDEALAAFDQAMTVLNGAAAATDPAEQKQRANMKLELLTNAMEVHRLKAVGGVDSTKAKEASTVFTQYFETESDPAKKSTAQLTLGDILRENGDCDAAIAAYKAILATSADNPDALAGAGLCLFSVGYGNSDKAQMQEGLNLMTRFTQVAPETHKLKGSVRDAVDLLKNEQNLTPQKVTPVKKKT